MQRQCLFCHQHFAIAEPNELYWSYDKDDILRISELFLLETCHYFSRYWVLLRYRYQLKWLMLSALVGIDKTVLYSSRI